MTIDLSQSKTQWSLGMKVRRGLWTYLLEPCVRWLPKFCSPVRILALRWMGASIGPACLILPGVKVLMPWNLFLEGHVAIGESVNIYNFAPVTIGRMTVISQYVFLCTGSHDHRHPHMPLTYAPITIGSNCWVAAGAFVAPGVAIEQGVVVGAMSVLSRSITTAWSVWAGNPCVFKKSRQMVAT